MQILFGLQAFLASLLAISVIHARPYIDLGNADGLALDQPRVTVEFFDSEEGSLGPQLANSFLLDTGAERILIAGNALSELQANGYRTSGKIIEQGVSGFSTFDVSIPYQLNYAGTSGTIQTLRQVRALSSASSNFGSFGGIIGMPGMTGRTVSMDFTGFGSNDIFSAFVGVEFSNTLPAGEGHRYTVPLQLIKFPITEPDPPTTASGIPFLTAIVHSPTYKRRGRMLLDTGGQISILSEHFAFALGLDSDGDGNFDNEAVSRTEVGGIGGAISVPILNLGDIAVPTREGTDLVWNNVQGIILEIHPLIDGVFGSDLLTSGWLSAFLGGQDGYIRKAHCDFREAENHRGTLAIDINPLVDIPLPGQADTDLDGNNIPDAWEDLFYNELNSPRADQDNDGIPLLLEHALNTDPTNVDPHPLQLTRVPGGTLKLGFSRNRELPFSRLVLETSPTLGDNSWLPVRAQAISIKPLDSLTDRLEVTIQPPDEVCFFRLRATVLQ
ncbi:MAG: retropepsin-like domain-containing protein [Verrucomicrobiales bacterium]|nr:retropepsin-like domain-containing protein [Verrucomicrobiales bacterium]